MRVILQVGNVPRAFDFDSKATVGFDKPYEGFLEVRCPVKGVVWFNINHIAAMTLEAQPKPPTVRAKRVRDRIE